MPQNDKKNYSICLRTLIEEITPLFPIGIPSAKFPAFEPLRYPGLRFENALAAFEMVGDISDLKVFEANKFDIINVWADPEKLFFQFKAQIPSIQSITDYKINGTLLYVPLTSSGQFRGNFCKLIVRNTSLKSNNHY